MFFLLCAFFVSNLLYGGENNGTPLQLPIFLPFLQQQFVQQPSGNLNRYVLPTSAAPSLQIFPTDNDLARIQAETRQVEAQNAALEQRLALEKLQQARKRQEELTLLLQQQQQQTSHRQTLIEPKQTIQLQNDQGRAPSLMLQQDHTKPDINDFRQFSTGQWRLNPSSSFLPQNVPTQQHLLPSSVHDQTPTPPSVRQHRAVHHAQERSTAGQKAGLEKLSDAIPAAKRDAAIKANERMQQSSSTKKKQAPSKRNQKRRIEEEEESYDDEDEESASVGAIDQHTITAQQRTDKLNPNLVKVIDSGHPSHQQSTYRCLLCKKPEQGFVTTCLKTTSNKSIVGIENHFSTNHSDKLGSLYQCMHCRNTYFANNSNWHIHQKKIHDNPSPKTCSTIANRSKTLSGSSLQHHAIQQYNSSHSIPNEEESDDDNEEIVLAARKKQLAKVAATAVKDKENTKTTSVTVAAVCEEDEIEEEEVEDYNKDSDEHIDIMNSSSPESSCSSDEDYAPSGSSNTRHHKNKTCKIRKKDTNTKRAIRKKTFSQEDYLNSNLVGKNGRGDYVCLECQTQGKNETFTSLRDGLLPHFKKMHENAHKLLFPCHSSSCNKRYTTMAGLARHLKLNQEHHNSLPKTKEHVSILPPSQNGISNLSPTDQEGMLFAPSIGAACAAPQETYAPQPLSSALYGAPIIRENHYGTEEQDPIFNAPKTGGSWQQHPSFKAPSENIPNNDEH